MSHTESLRALSGLSGWSQLSLLSRGGKETCLPRGVREGMVVEGPVGAVGIAQEGVCRTKTSARLHMLKGGLAQSKAQFDLLLAPLHNSVMSVSRTRKTWNRDNESLSGEARTPRVTLQYIPCVSSSLRDVQFESAPIGLQTESNNHRVFLLVERNHGSDPAYSRPFAWLLTQLYGRETGRNLNSVVWQHIGQLGCTGPRCIQYSGLIVTNIIGVYRRQVAGLHLRLSKQQANAQHEIEKLTTRIQTRSEQILSSLLLNKKNAILLDVLKY